MVTAREGSSGYLYCDLFQDNNSAASFNSTGLSPALATVASNPNVSFVTDVLTTTSRTCTMGRLVSLMYFTMP